MYTIKNSFEKYMDSGKVLATATTRGGKYQMLLLATHKTSDGKQLHDIIHLTSGTESGCNCNVGDFETAKAKFQKYACDFAQIDNINFTIKYI